MSANRWFRSRAAGAGLLSAKVTAPATLMAVSLGYVLDGSVGAAIAAALTFLALIAVSAANTVVPYLRAGKLHETSGPPAATALPATDVTSEETFWATLTPDERHALIARARGHLYRKEDVLCHEGETAGDIIVILSGWTRVWVRDGPDQRIIAFRGAGELVAPAVRERCATVTAETDVQALRIDACDFGVFMNERPHGP